MTLKKMHLHLRHMRTSITLEHYLCAWNPATHLTRMTSPDAQDTPAVESKTLLITALGKLRLRDVFKSHS